MRPLLLCLLLALLVRGAVAVADPWLPDNLGQLAAWYDIDIATAQAAVSIPTAFGPIQAQPCNVTEIGGYSPLLYDEFQLYPKPFVKLSRLRRIVLCSNLSYAGQPRLAVPDVAHQTLYLQAEQRENRQNRQWSYRLVIHHEFFHIVEAQVEDLYTDPEWVALNPIGFHYGNGGKNALRSSEGPPPAEPAKPYVGPGFVDSYATTAVEEDKAETFAYLMVRYGNITSRAYKDEVLATKVALMKQRLQSWCPEMDDQFWLTLANTPVLISSPRQ